MGGIIEPPVNTTVRSGLRPGPLNSHSDEKVDEIEEEKLKEIDDEEFKEAKKENGDDGIIRFLTAGRFDVGPAQDLIRRLLEPYCHCEAHSAL